MNQLERMARRMAKRQTKAQKEAEKARKIKISSLKKMARLFRACGDLVEIQAIRLEKKL